MRRQSTIVVAAALVCLVAPFTPASAQTARPPESTMARAAAGSIRGVVLDTQGRPLVGAMVSALGATVAFALTGRDGRFLFDSLPPGAYTVRVHLDGFVPSQRRMVEVRSSSAPSIMSVALKALALSSAAPDGRPILAAGVFPLDGAKTGAEPATDAASAGDADYDHGETAWRLRHLKRSVLKDVDSPMVLADAYPEPVAGGPGSLFGRAFESSARFAASLFTDFPLSGQVNFITTGAFGAPSGPGQAGAVYGSNVAYISLGAPAGPLGNWTVSGAMTQGNIGSWFVTGALTARPSSTHRYVTGLTYSTQQVNGADPFALAAISSGSRSVGRVYGFDEWKVSRRVTVGYGLAYVWQDYLRTDGLVSPRASLTLSPADRVRVRAVLARTETAPGADEFLNAMNAPAGVWLPAQRSFSPWSERDGLRAQTTDHVEFGIERDVAAYVVGIRTFVQRVDDQSGAMFAVPTLGHPAAGLGHYYLATLGDVDARGWGVRVSRPLLGLLRGSVDYSVTRARWLRGPEGAMAAWFGEGQRPEYERVQDLTTSLEAAISQTSTHVFVLYKLNSGFARQTLDARNPGLDARFDVQINQALPFLNFTSADWEVLVAVCNLFRDSSGERSVYDELLVIRPPKRVVGGVRVRF
jgi:hypothetical protein